MVTVLHGCVDDGGRRCGVSDGDDCSGHCPVVIVMVVVMMMMMLAAAVFLIVMKLGCWECEFRSCQVSVLGS